MVKVTLYSQANDQTIELTNSTVTTVGRGFFACQDKRVSRKHGELTVLGTKLKVKACHVNPIFYKRNGQTQNQILEKNAEILLANKDKFSLLPNEFEYEVKVVEDQQVAENQIDVGNGADNEQGAVGIETERDSDPPPSPNVLLETPGASTNDQADHRSPAGPSESKINRKRSTDGNDGEEESAKRQKPSTSDSNTPVNAETPKWCVKNQVHKQENEEPQDDPMQHRNIKPDPVKAVKSETAVVIKPDPDGTSAQTSAPSTSRGDVKIKPDPDGPTDKPTSSSAIVKSDAAAVKAETAGTPTNQTPNVPSKPNQPNVRPSCRFGIGCYLHTADHRRDSAHPLEPDYRRPDYAPAAEDVPRCPFWASCYRRNPEHFRVLQHPLSNVYSTQPVVPPPAPVQNVPVVRPNVQVIRQNDSDNEAEDLEEDIFDDSEIDEDFIDDGDDAGISSGSSDPEDEENNLEE